tara:strand:+ start:106 stop:348 length:243 start_codon:yes stop_codon:yes gene_type:complete
MWLPTIGFVYLRINKNGESHKIKVMKFKMPKTKKQKLQEQVIELVNQGHIVLTDINDVQITPKDPEFKIALEDFLKSLAY